MAKKRVAESGSWFRLVTFSGIQATEELDDESSGGGIPLKF